MSNINLKEIEDIKKEISAVKANRIALETQKQIAKENINKIIAECKQNFNIHPDELSKNIESHINEIEKIKNRILYTLHPDKYPKPEDDLIQTDLDKPVTKTTNQEEVKEKSTNDPEEYSDDFDPLSIEFD